MSEFRAATVAVNVPATVVLIGWISFGRALFGIGVGWMGLIAPMLLIPVLAFTTTLSTILLARQGDRRPRLAAAQGGLQVVCWVCLFTAGLAIGDFDDHTGYGGVLAHWLGDTAAAAQFGDTVLLLSALGWVTAYLALVGSALIGVTEADRPTVLTRAGVLVAGFAGLALVVPHLVNSPLGWVLALGLVVGLPFSIR
ncbi:hypothetical protein [Mycobacterium sp. 1274756.6]|uniref:hypothetical protein n=1 Tax=Mycobacterium sp. 1274756.6 TaxID=1834076 RepID=UPI0007FB8244|nr:hypothetical protein [Mycobacterium sp. 1274756.6]OBJ73085.1 hypothetical protein A5643_04635 [Mycobacterium sp. 1274756.6]